MAFDSSRRKFLQSGLILPAAGFVAAHYPDAFSQTPAGPAYRTLGRTGLKVTTLGAGCAWTADPSVLREVFLESDRRQAFVGEHFSSWSERITSPLIFLATMIFRKYVRDSYRRIRVAIARINAYLQEITGEDFTAKDFRTWSGTVLAAIELRSLPAESETQARANVSRAMKVVSARLGNTPRICRTSYVHPAIIARYLDGSLARRLHVRASKRKESAITPDERAVLGLLHLEARLPAA